MPTLAEAVRDHVNTQLREAAIIIDMAQHETPVRKGDSNIIVAAGVLRSWRRTIEQNPDRGKVEHYLKELADDLSLVGGCARPAVELAVRLISDAHQRVATSASDVNQQRS